jgi:hypothetical protein
VRRYFVGLKAELMELPPTVDRLRTPKVRFTEAPLQGGMETAPSSNWQEEEMEDLGLRPFSTVSAIVGYLTDAIPLAVSGLIRLATSTARPAVAAALAAGQFSVSARRNSVFGLSPSCTVSRESRTASIPLQP